MVQAHNSPAEIDYHLELFQSMTITTRRISCISTVASNARETAVTRTTTTGCVHGSAAGLPMRLGRPVLHEVDADYLHSLDPSSGVWEESQERVAEESVPPPPHYIRDMLAGMPMMVPYTGISIYSPNSVLPREIKMILTPYNDGTVCPTHILALPTSQQGKYYLFPIHELVFASNCSAFRPLPHSAAANPSPENPILDSVVLPVVLYRSPSPENFDLFRKYLYRKDLGLLRTAFLPTGWDQTMESVLRQMNTVYGFWLNACAFHLYDYDMRTFDLIDDCWGRVHQAQQRVSQ